LYQVTHENGFFNYEAVFVLASWSEMKEAKAKGLDVPSFYFLLLVL